MINKYSTITPALGIIWIYLTSAIADHARSRWGAIIFSQVFNLVGNIMLAVWYIPKGATWFAFCLQYFGWASSSVIYSWAADAMRHNPQQRAITVVSINMIGQATTAFTSVLVWKTVEAPRYLKGYSFTCTVIVVMMIWTTLMLPFYKKMSASMHMNKAFCCITRPKGRLPSVPQTLSDEEDYVQEHFVIEEEKKI